MADSGLLTARERHTLADIERELRRDERLDRALATMQSPAAERTLYVTRAAKPTPVPVPIRQ